MNIKFKCPDCGNKHGIEEVLCDVTLATILTKVAESGETTYAGGPAWHSGYLHHYQCSNCGSWLRRSDGVRPIQNAEDLHFWLKQRQMLD